MVEVMPMSLSEVRRRMAENMLAEMSKPEWQGVFDQAFAYPWVRIFHIVHWALVQFLGSFLLMGVVKVKILSV